MAEYFDQSFIGCSEPPQVLRNESAAQFADAHPGLELLYERRHTENSTKSFAEVYGDRMVPNVPEEFEPPANAFHSPNAEAAWFSGVLANFHLVPNSFTKVT